MLGFCRKHNIKLPIIIFSVAAMLAVTAFELKSTIDIAAATSFEKTLEQFPESYRDSLRKLHEAHPYWNFVAFNTGLDWDEVINGYVNENGDWVATEMLLKRNLVPDGIMTLKGIDSGWYATPTSWKDTKVNGSYNWSANSWVQFSGGGWVQASVEAVEYVMDPRNWLTENNIFMFEQLSYNAASQTYGTLKAMMDDTWMDCDYAKVGGTSKDYATVLIELGKQYNVSPVMLCARLIQEKGAGTYNSSTKKYVLNDTLANGVATSDDGKTFHAAKSGETPYYNMFNIQAAGTTAADVINNGGREAMNAGWTTQYLALKGGIESIVSTKMERGQDTLYFQKFSVVNEKYLYWNQYMQNLLAPVNEGYTVRSTYVENGVLDSSFTFRIPVYENMPETACASPSISGGTSTANPNYKLKSLTVKGKDSSGTTTTLSLTPTFNMDTGTYNITVPYKTTSVTISASAIASTSKVTGTGTKSLSVGKNTFKVVCKSEYGTSKTYTINVTRQEGSTYLTSLAPASGSFTKTFDKDTVSYTMYVDNSVTSIKFKYKTESSIANVKIRQGSTTTDMGAGSSTVTTPAFTLKEGTNTIYFDVYPSASDTSSVYTYKVSVVRYSDTSVDYKKLQTSGSYINGFDIGQKVSSAKKLLTVTNGSVKILDSAKKEKTDSQTVFTGDYLVIYDSNGKTYKTYRIVVYGDVDGTGSVDLFDFAYMKKQILKNSGLSGVYLEAADVYPASSGLDLFDIAAIKNYILRDGKIDQTR